VQEIALSLETPQIPHQYPVTHIRERINTTRSLKVKEYEAVGFLTSVRCGLSPQITNKVIESA
jgi:hypothetical protein